MPRKNRNIKGSKKWCLIIGIGFLAASGILLCYAANQEYQKAAAGKLYREIQVRELENSEEEQESESTSESADVEKEETGSSVKLPVNIPEIQKEMPDVYGWIEIPGTKVDYPIVQHPDDNSYYLDKTPDGQSNQEGSIFSERYNKKDFSDPVTVLYGHNMKNGDMFGELHRYEDRDFFREHRTIHIYTEKKMLEYEVFAATLFDNRHILQSYDFTSEEVLMQYIREVRGVHDMRSYYDTSIQIEKDDHILVLSTCHGMGSNYRYLIQAVLVNEET